jgi:hypothetical protein
MCRIKRCNVVYSPLHITGLQAIIAFAEPLQIPGQANNIKSDLSRNIV